MPTGLNRRFPPNPGKPGGRGPADIAGGSCGTRAQIEFVLGIQKLVMEATTRIELVYTVLQTVA